MLDDLDDRRARASIAGGALTVLDTNVLLHYLPVDQVSWSGIVGNQNVRIVIPIRVIEEVAKKYARRPDLAMRARNPLKALEQLLARAGAPGRVSDGVTIEVPVDTGPRSRPPDAGEEALETIRELSQLSGQPVTLVTGDTGCGFVPKRSGSGPR